MPVENIELLSRYGCGERRASSSTGSAATAWQRAQGADEGAHPRDRRRADQDRRGARSYAPGRRSPSPTRSYAEFVDRFPYEETDDQDRAIDDVLEDLDAGKPMDRLICGDVGFGKTEVALRAAFVAAMAGKQVALMLSDHPPRSPALPATSSTAFTASR